MRQTKPVEQIVTPKNQIRMQKKVHVMKQAEVKRNMLECVKVVEKVILSIQMRNQMEKVVKRRRLNELSVVGKVTLNFLMIKQRKELLKRKRLEYVSIGEKV